MPEPGPKTAEAIFALAANTVEAIALANVWEGSKKGEQRVAIPGKWKTKKVLKEAVSLYCKAKKVMERYSALEKARMAQTAFIRRMEAKHRALHHKWTQSSVYLTAADYSQLSELEGKVDGLRVDVEVCENAVAELLKIVPTESRFAKQTIARLAKQQQDASKAGNPAPRSPIAKKKKNVSKPAFSLDAFLVDPANLPPSAPISAISLSPPADADYSPAHDWPEPEGVEECYGFSEMWDDMCNRAAPSKV